MPAFTKDRITDWPLWWFARLDAALERDDRRIAQEALRRLEQMGIEVRFRVPARRRKEACRER
jgi:hypothetical protein